MSPTCTFKYCTCNSFLEVVFSRTWHSFEKILKDCTCSYAVSNILLYCTYHHCSRSQIIKTIWQMYLVKRFCIQFCSFSQCESPLHMFCQISAVAVELCKFVFLQVEKKCNQSILNNKITII